MAVIDATPQAGAVQPIPIQTIDDELIQSVIEKAKLSPRRRMNHNFHSGPADNPHRFLNVFLEGSYVAPHRHSAPPKAESFIVLDGYVAVFCFEENGDVRSRHLIGSGTLPLLRSSFPPAVRGIDIAPGIWHTITAVTPVAVCFEVKPGPWEPTSDKEFAAWAPLEGDAQVAAYLDSLLAG